MKKQLYKHSLGLLVVMLAAAISCIAQNPLPSGKYLLKLKATAIHRVQVTDQPEHSLVVNVVTVGKDVTITTDVSKENITGHSGVQPGESSLRQIAFTFTVNGSDNWLNLKGRTSLAGTSIDNGSFVFVPGTGGTAPTTAAPENLSNSTMGSFTLMPYSDKMQTVSDPGKAKEIMNSTEEWWVAFKKWMTGGSF